MLKRIIQNYYKLLDEKLENGTVIVLMIAFLVVAIWDVTNASTTNNNSYVKASISEYNKSNQFIEVNWKTYKLVD